MVSPEGHSIGPRLQALRESLGLTQQELAFRSGVSGSGIARIEQEQKTGMDPKLSTLAALARGLDMKVSQLVAVLLQEAPPRVRGRKEK